MCLDDNPWWRTILQQLDRRRSRAKTSPSCLSRCDLEAGAFKIVKFPSGKHFHDGHRGNKHHHHDPPHLEDDVQTGSPRAQHWSFLTYSDTQLYTHVVNWRTGHGFGLKGTGIAWNMKKEHSPKHVFLRSVRRTLASWDNSSCQICERDHLGFPSPLHPTSRHTPGFKGVVVSSRSRNWRNSSQRCSKRRLASNRLVDIYNIRNII